MLLPILMVKNHYRRAFWTEISLDNRQISPDKGVLQNLSGLDEIFLEFSNKL